MIITGKIVDEIEIKAAGDVFHELFGTRPHEISTMAPDKIHGCDLHEGDWGKVGTIICWDYTHDGKKKVAKEVIEELDEENKTVKFRVFEGDLMEHFKTLSLQIHVKTHGINNLVTWTIEYEKLNKDVPDPISLMEFCIHVSKDIESHHHDKK
ncbi:hypothetical protein LIER_18734 [Lithospermum erythrorhizon]|uniref:Bet v I/Major latex protein domain-containing protein n=1 Tax=Lithospermum erythrorhizon TaxID=34254 RepID=A0AAV3QHN4_LITER